MALSANANVRTQTHAHRYKYTKHQQNNDGSYISIEWLDKCVCVSAFVCVCVYVFLYVAFAFFLYVCYPVHLLTCVIKIHCTIQRSRPIPYFDPTLPIHCHAQ